MYAFLKPQFFVAEIALLRVILQMETQHNGAVTICYSSLVGENVVYLQKHFMARTGYCIYMTSAYILLNRTQPHSLHVTTRDWEIQFPGVTRLRKYE